jgi:hypothetical protein
MEDFKKQLLPIINIEFIGLKFSSNIYEKEYHNNSFYIIGNDYENEIGINKTNLEVFSLSKNDCIFINSSLTNLINCINFFMQKIDFREDYNEKERYQAIKEIKKEFVKIDNKVLDENCWWSFIIEETKDGLL